MQNRIAKYLKVPLYRITKGVLAGLTGILVAPGKLQVRPGVFITCDPKILERVQ